MPFSPKIAMISTADIVSGGGIAAYRLHEGLRGQGIDSRMIVIHKHSTDETVYPARPEPGNRFSLSYRKIAYSLENWLNWYGVQHFYAYNHSGMKRHPVFRQADIVHVQGMHSIYQSFSLRLFSCTGARPVVWTLHDMWALTGHCIYSYDCENWRNGCGQCPNRASYIGIKFDTTAWMCRAKRRFYGKAKPVIATPSQWLKQVAMESAVLKDFEVVCIPNGIDVEKYLPLEQSSAQQALKLPKVTGKVILFLAAAIGDIRKGYHVFEQAMLDLKERLPGSLILTVGLGELSAPLKEAYQYKEMGYVSDQQLINTIYAAADFLVVPSSIDNLPNVILESLACGTPVVAFATGGIPDMVRHGYNGLLAEKNNGPDLAQKIYEISTDSGLLKILKQNARQIILDNFSMPLQVQRFIDLYRDLMRTKNNNEY